MVNLSSRLIRNVSICHIPDFRFVGGELNTCYNCLDRHVERGFGSQPAIIHDSPVTNTIRKISYKELLSEACDSVIIL